MANFTVFEDQLQFECHGDGAAVFLLHSLGGSLDMFRTSMAHLGRWMRVVAFDARGHGASSGNEAFSIRRYARDCIALADHLGIERMAVVGISMGARAAAHVAAAVPERVTALVIADTAPGDGSRSLIPLETTRKRIAEIGPDAFAEEYTRSRLMPGTDGAVAKRFADGMVRTLPKKYIEALFAISTDNTNEVLGRISAPTLLLGGEFDVSASPAMVRQFQDFIPAARFELIEDANHLSNLDQPDRFNQLLGNFLL